MPDFWPIPREGPNQTYKVISWPTFLCFKVFIEIDSQNVLINNYVAFRNE